MNYMQQVMKLPLRLICILLLFSCVIAPVCGEPYAYLEEGPVYRSGLPFCSPNRTENRYAVYRVGERRVEVFLVYADVWMEDDWYPIGLDEGESVYVNSTDSETIARVDRTGYRLFFLFQNGETRDELLLFINAFIDRLNVFLNRTKDIENLPLPAILHAED